LHQLQQQQQQQQQPVAASTDVIPNITAQPIRDYNRHENPPLQYMGDRAVVNAPVT